MNRREQTLLFFAWILLVLGCGFSNAEWYPGGTLPFNYQDTSLTSNEHFLFYAGGSGLSGHYSMIYMVNLTRGYDSTMQWKLSVGRSAIASAVLGTKVYFAGGDTDSGTTDLVEIFDYVAEEWTTAKLSKARAAMKAAVVGQSILFVGGREQSYNQLPSNLVDIYHAKNDTWTTTILTYPRRNLEVAVIGSRALFAGGFPLENSDMVEIYDGDTETWSQDNLSLKRTSLAAAALGDMAFFAGGDTANGITDRIDIFYGNNNTWGRAELSVPRTKLVAASAGDQVLFVAGWADVPTKAYIADIMFMSGRWETVPLPANRGGSNWLATTAGSSIYFYAPGGTYGVATQEHWNAWNGTTGIHPVSPPGSYVPYKYNYPSANQPGGAQYQPQNGRVSSSVLIYVNAWISLGIVGFVCMLARVVAT